MVSYLVVFAVITTVYLKYRKRQSAARPAATDRTTRI
jgi:hypothetical protein